MSKETVYNEELEKSIDSLIDDFFAEEESSEESVEKAEGSQEEGESLEEETSEAELEKADAITQIVGEGPKAAMPKDPNRTPATTADSSDNNLSEKTEDDVKAGKKRGRSEDLSQMDERNMASGESTHEGYDASIVETLPKVERPEDSQVKPPEHVGSKQSYASANDSGKGHQSSAKQKPEESTPEQDQVAPPSHMKKAEEVTISRTEFEEMKKAWEAKKAEEAETLKKADREENASLIKSAVQEATEELRKSNSELRSELNETRDLLKSITKKPQPRKAITSVAALEKGGFDGKPEFFSKSETLDAIEDLVKSKQITVEEAVEYESTGTLYNEDSRRKVETFLKKRN